MGLEKVNVLLVDDRPDGLITLEAVLTNPDYNLFKAESGAEALALILDHEFAVIILDVQMPGMDGFETASYIKRREKSRNIPIIFVTAINKDPFLVHKGYEAGAVDYLFKPFDPRVLKSKVSVFVELYRANRAILEQSLLLQQAEESKRIIFESASDIIATTDMNGRITSLSPSFEVLTGWTPTSWLDRTLEDLMSDDDKVEFRKSVYSALGGASMLTESHLVSKIGQSLKMETALKPLLQRGQPLGVIAVMRDTTQRYLAEEERRHREELERSNRDLELFASICSHDLQEPLRVIRTFATFLKSRNADVPATAQGLESIIQGTNRMNVLIRDILNYSKVGGTEVVSTMVDSERALDRAVANLDLAFKESGARVERGSLPTLFSNDLHMVQLFQNLISNAIKFRSKSIPVVHVGARSSKDGWVFEISDNGIGFEMDHAAKIFDVFRRLHRNDEYPGTGVGLGICKKIIERQGGKIWAESTPGKGSSFFFCIPDRSTSRGSGLPSHSNGPSN
jgi:PAS domain S-box-containing protein